MTEEGLHTAQVYAGLDETGGACVTQDVRHHVRVAFQSALLLCGIPIVLEVLVGDFDERPCRRTELAASLGTDDEDETAHRIAAVREALEETGLAVGIAQQPTADEVRRARELLLESGALAPVLDAMGWTLELDRIVPFARWNPRNERIPRIFDTRFYLADLGTGAVELEIDDTETTHLFWTTAAGALEAADRGEIALIFPTRRNLERLAGFASYAEARAQAEAIPVRTITPWMEERGGETWLRIPSDAGYPVDGEPLTSVARG